ncbi:hypothetical protein [Pseudoalteromonas luteoviolacea]|uniref:Uncharacterized protein n=1 Tax=Pseudoalteromonas luteoviolacea S4060-1 TaxID=1365257 RepID=A0A162BG32_9GAMM|nr:hypothetical protein [Pseudoalteromonas luteoviolacea]KZN61527.1 hypothetical protein N478_05490 [Pseudoalteromonas luteoviolacea S4060-1]
MILKRVKQNLKLSVILLSTISFGAYSSNDDTAPLIEMLIIDKHTGACGMIQQMASFQSSTKMEGGAEFIQRFVNTEAARLGKTSNEFIKECEESIARYSGTMKALGYGG